MFAATCASNISYDASTCLYGIALTLRRGHEMKCSLPFSRYLGKKSLRLAHGMVAEEWYKESNPSHAVLDHHSRRRAHHDGASLHVLEESAGEIPRVEAVRATVRRNRGALSGCRTGTRRQPVGGRQFRGGQCQPGEPDSPRAVSGGGAGKTNRAPVLGGTGAA